MRFTESQYGVTKKAKQNRDESRPLPVTNVLYSQPYRARLRSSKQDVSFFILI